MAHFIDAMGKACPQPVILTRQALDAGQVPLMIAVDNTTAVENLKRLAASRGIEATVKEEPGRYEVSFPQSGQAEAAQKKAGSYAVFIGKGILGDGDAILGYNLLKMFLYTLSQSEDVPASVLFMNGGVKLPAGDEADVVDSIRALEQKGAAILVCGTCLNYYGIADQIKVGVVSNMYDIVTKMQEAEKVITV